jgi:uncharacterized cupin superfamily protein
MDRRINVADAKGLRDAPLRRRAWRHASTRSPMPEIKAVALLAAEVPLRARASNYPAPFASRVRGREKRPLAAQFGLSNFGVNLTTLAPQAQSALRHAHTKQDELIYILEGYPTLYTHAGATKLSPGMYAGFKAGTGDAHHLVNESPGHVVYLEIGDRTAGDSATYPDDDLVAVMMDGEWRFTHKDGTPY